MDHLVFVTWTLAVLSQTLHSLVYESHVLLIDVEAQQAQSSSGAATDAVQKLEGLTDQVVVVLIVLVTQEVLRRNEEQSEADAGKSFFSQQIKRFLRTWETWSSATLPHDARRSKSKIFLGENRA